MEPLFEKHYVSLYFLVSTTDVELPCRNTVSKSLLLFFYYYYPASCCTEKKNKNLQLLL